MGEYLTKLFPSPESMPDGDHWKIACDLADQALAGENVTVTDWEDSSCDWGESETKIYGFLQTLFMGGVYASVLFYASNEISEGSEKLLLIPSWRAIVGTVVLPILGAVPDGAIVLFSGLGQDAQNQISVGVGALAGSTIMLLTIPWFLSIFAGRVKINETDGKCDYTSPKLRSGRSSWGDALFRTGCELKSAVSENANYMLITSVSYFLCQGVLFSSKSHGVKSDDDDNLDDLKRKDRWWALVSCVLCFGLFFAYLYRMISRDDRSPTSYVSEARFMKRLKRAIRNGDANIATAFFEEVNDASAAGDNDLKKPLNDGDVRKRIRDVCKSLFRSYDIDGNGTLNVNTELPQLLKDLGIGPVERKAMAAHLSKLDDNHNGRVSLDEFVAWIPGFVRFVGSDAYHDALERARSKAKGTRRKSVSATSSKIAEDAEELESALVGGDAEEGLDVMMDVEEEEDEEPDEENAAYFVIDPATGKPKRDANGKPIVDREKVKRSAFSQMFVGTMLVLLFSDPMCDVFTSIGNRVGIDPFYVSFVLAPLASNASELIAALNFASKKTRHTATVSMTQLEGAAIMNNTFCLGIFMLLIFAKDLAWTFSAETISILAVQVIMFAVAKCKTQNLFLGYLVLAVYPLSLVLVALLEKVAGLD
eukprot:g912.t1